MQAPRLAPPRPERPRLEGFRHAARVAGLRPFPWQLLVAEYLGARVGSRYAFREVALIVARQNGKTTLLVPLIIERLLAGRRIMHTAQNRELPREVFGQVADALDSGARAAVRSIRTANGQETVTMRNGGRYRIVAPNRGGARGPSNDLLIVDEVRELEGWAFVAAARPTLTASLDPQTVWLSNAGEPTSSVLNSLRARAGLDPSLAYLEWSADPDRAASDRAGWRQANPSLGLPRRAPLVTVSDLAAEYRSLELSGQLAIFEVEHLCRWVSSMLQRPVSDVAWAAAARPLEAARRPCLGVSVSSTGSRASAALAWVQADGTVALTLTADVTGSPLDVDELGRLLRARARELRVQRVGFDPATDRDLARHLTRPRKPEPIAAATFAAASDRFVRTVEAGRLRHADAEAVGADLAFTGLQDRGDGSRAIVAADPERSVTGALAAVRAVWLATEPAPARARVY